MGVRDRIFHRHRHRLAVLTAIAAGALFGLGGFFTKIAVGGAPLAILFSSPLVLNPVAWLAALAGIAGFVLLQTALRHGRLSVVTPIITGVSIVVPVLLALAVLGERISPLNGIGILLILAGSIGLSRK